MGLRADPVGGGQFQVAVKQIIEAERQPIKQLEVRKSREEQKMKLFQEFKGKFSGVDKAVGELSSFKKFRELKVDLGDGQNLMSVTVDKDKAEPGVYSVQIDQLAARTSIISNGFEDPDEPILGIGYITMDLANGKSSELFVDEENSSLRGVANMINRESDYPVRASVIKDSSDLENPWKLIITAKQDGAGNQIAFPDFYFLDGKNDLFIDDDREARNALIQLDGFPIQVESNQVNDFLPGVNVQLKQAKPDQPFTLSITEDHAKISGKVKALVDQMNGILEFINKQNQIDDASDTRTTFAGDTSLQNVEYRLRNLVHEGFPVTIKGTEDYDLVFLNQLGVEFDKKGMLSFKEDQFTKSLQKNFEGIAEAITGQFGFAFQLKEVMSGYTRPNDGLLALREQGLRSRIKDIDRQIDSKERILEKRTQALTDKFSRLQATLGNLQRQQQYMSATMANMGGGNIISQLMGG